MARSVRPSGPHDSTNDASSASGSSGGSGFGGTSGSGGSRGGAADPDAPLRGLVGSGRTHLPPLVAMRARDVAQPTDEDLAEAERTLVLRPPGRVANRALRPGEQARPEPRVQDAGDAASGTAGISPVRS
ncbi:hypothetical protein MXD59_11165 [Frankia sp. Ag45/Mut15]|uniref:Uncharacterized protein n=1 Tax=Frankia umida TaxID=573489 RepID=A0ABT0JXQ7_9ACTN|nr:hypothetical protein [Frankia umida]MCK9876328.1 hypothetical protein [Frankia umida]